MRGCRTGTGDVAADGGVIPAQRGGAMPLALRADLDHPWRVTREEAAALQQKLAAEVVLRPLPAAGPDSPRLAAGVDVAYSKDGSRAGPWPW